MRHAKVVGREPAPQPRRNNHSERLQGEAELADARAGAVAAVHAGAAAQRAPPAAPLLSPKQASDGGAAVHRGAARAHLEVEVWGPPRRHDETHPPSAPRRSAHGDGRGRGLLLCPKRAPHGAAARCIGVSPTAVGIVDYRSREPRR